ncbi:MAG: lamin tail domain-containing protein, partial [Chloroflexota bacterium]
MKTIRALTIMTLIGFLLALNAVPTGAASATLVINEVMYNPTGDEPSGEWVEIYVNSSPGNVSGWTLTDQDVTTPYTFPSFIPAAGEYIVVHTGSGTDDSTGPVYHLYWGRDSSVWNNGGDDVLLTDGTNSVDYIAYGGDDGIDLPPSGLSWGGANPSSSEGASISLKANGVDGDSGDGWEAAGTLVTTDPSSMGVNNNPPGTVWVDDDYCDGCPNDGHTWGYDAFDTIQAGINAVTSGGTVNVGSGTYTPAATIQVNKTVTILGPQANVDPRPGGGTTRTAGSAGEAIIDGSTYSLGEILKIDADNVVMNGLEVKSGTKDMIRQSNAHSGTATRYNIIHDGRGDEGAQLAKCTSCVMEYNYVYDIASPGDALNFADSSDCAIRYNEVRNIGSENAAIFVYGSTNTTIEGNLVYDITQNDGIKLGDKNGADAGRTGGSILDNVVHDTKQDGIAVYTSHTLVEGNEVYNSASENGAIYVAFGVSSVTVTRNHVHDNTLATGKWGDPGGIMLGTAVNAASVAVHNNCITDNSPNGVTNKATGLLDAENNWWGASDGPSGSGSGSGDAVSTNVDYDPWLTMPPSDVCPPPAPNATITFHVHTGAAPGTGRPGYRVHVYNPGGGEVAWKDTDGNGDAAFLLNNGNYEYAVEKNGAYSTRRAFFVAGVNQTINHQLSVVTVTVKDHQGGVHQGYRVHVYRSAGGAGDEWAWQDSDVNGLTTFYMVEGSYSYQVEKNGIWSNAYDFTVIYS